MGCQANVIHFHTALLLPVGIKCCIILHHIEDITLHCAILYIMSVISQFDVCFVSKLYMALQVVWDQILVLTVDPMV